MNINTELLQFLDGTISPDAEAELLHRLSVSPERRDILRSFINQQVLFQRDRNSIAVPYAAEQKLWARLGEIMPPVLQQAAPAVVEAPIVVTNTPMFRSVYAVASIVVMSLLVGLGSGYFVGKNSVTAINANSAVTSTAVINASQPTRSLASESTPNSTEILNNLSARRETRHFANASSGSMNNSLAEAPLSRTADANSISANPAVAEEKPTAIATPMIPTSTPKGVLISSTGTDNIVGEHRQAFSFGNVDAEDETPQKPFLQRFEFYFNDAIGRQYPNNNATNVSMAVMTNQSIAALYQPWDNAHGIGHNVWAGATIGTANVTQKKFSIVQKDPIDPKKGYEMVADLVHVQTTYLGGLLQYRVPVSGLIGIPITGFLTPSAAGMIYGCEVGVHVAAAANFGFVTGLRATYLSYSLDTQQQEVISQGASAFGTPVPVGSGTRQLSKNFELSGGFYFHF
ncbi:MAG: hypothetical protein WCH46_08710 [bacterium]